MPVHRVKNAELEAKVAELEKSEEIVGVSSAGDGAFVIVTAASRAKPGKVEKR